MNASEREPIPVCSACGAEMDLESTACFHCGHARRSPPLKKGQVIADRYELTGVLGRGGMGTVYEAHDRSLDERVALKVLSETARGSADADRRFRAEIKLARKIRHPNVCAIHEYGELADIQYIVMEFVDGQDLKKYMRSRGTLTASEAVDLACQIGEGLQAIHEAGVIHRDLKLANVMRDRTGRLRLMDFGIAKGMGDTTATATGHIVGTPEYMSPEQARGEKVDLRSDVYSLAILTHELLTGRVPFKADTPLATMMLHVNEPPRLDDPRILPGFAPVLGKALAKRPEERYESARAYVSALRSAMVAIPSSTFASAPSLAAAADQATVEIVNARSAPLSQTLERPAFPAPARRGSSPALSSARRGNHLVGASAAALFGLAVAVWLGTRAVDFSRDAPEANRGQPAAQRASTEAAEVAPPDAVQPTPAASPSAGRMAAATPLTARLHPTPPVTSAIGTTPPSLTRAPSLTRPPAEPSQSPEAVRDATPLPALDAVATPKPVPPATPTPGAETQRVADAQRLSETSAPREEATAPTAPRPSAMALLVISVKPAAEITLDGKVLGETGAYTAPVAPGEHVIRFAHKNWQPLSRTVSVGSGERLKVAIDLKDEGIPKKK